MFGKFARTAALSLALIIALFSLASCFGVANTTESTTETVTLPETVKPADAAKNIDLKKADPSTDDVKFSFDDDGRIIEIEYTKGDVLYVVSYNYRDDGTVDAYLFGGGYTLDFVKYKPAGSFDKSAGFVELEGYYFNGYKSLEKVEVETESETETESESSPESETATDTEAATESETE